MAGSELRSLVGWGWCGRTCLARGGSEPGLGLRPFVFSGVGPRCSGWCACCAEARLSDDGAWVLQTWMSNAGDGHSVANAVGRPMTLSIFVGP